MLSRLTLICAILGGAAVRADDSFTKSLTPADYQAAGLGKLSPEELARLDELVRAHQSGALAVANQETTKAVTEQVRQQVQAEDRKAAQKQSAPGGFPIGARASPPERGVGRGEPGDNQGGDGAGPPAGPGRGSQGRAKAVGAGRLSGPDEGAAEARHRDRVHDARLDAGLPVLRLEKGGGVHADEWPALGRDRRAQLPGARARECGPRPDHSRVHGQLLHGNRGRRPSAGEVPREHGRCPDSAGAAVGRPAASSAPGSGGHASNGAAVSSSVSTIRAMLRSLSPSASVRSLTPFAPRPVSLISLTRVRMLWPLAVSSMTSPPSRTLSAPATLTEPSSGRSIAMTPVPPRLMSR